MINRHQNKQFKRLTKNELEKLFFAGKITADEYVTRLMEVKINKCSH
jgi:hypothetical protein